MRTQREHERGGVAGGVFAPDVITLADFNDVTRYLRGEDLFLAREGMLLRTYCDRGTGIIYQVSVAAGVYRRTEAHARGTQPFGPWLTLVC